MWIDHAVLQKTWLAIVDCIHGFSDYAVLHLATTNRPNYAAVRIYEHLAG
jgi:hypothetical protein